LGISQPAAITSFFAVSAHPLRQCEKSGLGSCGTLEKTATIANHASTRATQLYDRRSDKVSLDEIERILILRLPQCARPPCRVSARARFGLSRSLRCRLDHHCSSDGLSNTKTGLGRVSDTSN